MANYDEYNGHIKDALKKRTETQLEQSKTIKARNNRYYVQSSKLTVSKPKTDRIEDIINGFINMN